MKITNEQLIQIAAVDAGLDPFGEYLTRDGWKVKGYKVLRGEKPALVLDLWCPRIRKSSVASENAEPQQGEEKPGMFFHFKTCHLFGREQTNALERERLAQQTAALRIYHAYHQHNPETGYLEIVKGAPEVAKVAAEWIKTSKLGSYIFPIDFVQAEKDLKEQPAINQGALFEMAM